MTVVDPNLNLSLLLQQKTGKRDANQVNEFLEMLNSKHSFSPNEQIDLGHQHNLGEHKTTPDIKTNNASGTHLKHTNIKVNNASGTFLKNIDILPQEVYVKHALIADNGAASVPQNTASHTLIALLYGNEEASPVLHTENDDEHVVNPTQFLGGAAQVSPGLVDQDGAGQEGSLTQGVVANYQPNTLHETLFAKFINPNVDAMQFPVRFDETTPYTLPASMSVQNGAILSAQMLSMKPLDNVQVEALVNVFSQHEGAQLQALMASVMSPGQENNQGVILDAVVVNGSGTQSKHIASYKWTAYAIGLLSQSYGGEQLTKGAQIDASRHLKSTVHVQVAKPTRTSGDLEHKEKVTANQKFTEQFLVSTSTQKKSHDAKGTEKQAQPRAFYNEFAHEIAPKLLSFVTDKKGEFKVYYRDYYSDIESLRALFSEVNNLSTMHKQVAELTINGQKIWSQGQMNGN
ncbi:hypothetical protein L1286_22355 [Pseudoalteromonas sp. SMS1]|uniref:hypothetical protein n=1 Tax=Pseudoalteromonas sp. SMS1 TaxID=2908894 RepID=UPI001F3A1BB5|nr:hypothetical protein [Pseudoalteromonas sp. SMS1]MCF2860227.1 hypothetical protein [Pseudoalteromonas sp. SMS1]